MKTPWQQSHGCTVLSPSLRDWLLNPASMTARMNQVCNHDLRINLLSNHWEPPQPDERQLLAMKPRHLSMIRKVEMICCGKAWLYGRTVVPQQTLSGKHGHLKSLGRTPLGKVLFRDPTMERSPFEIAKVEAGHLEYEAATQSMKDKPNHLWARRSIFTLSEHPLLLMEVFLPEMLSFIAL